MQSDKDLEQSRRIGVEEQFIKFRPSPNFKNMKKFIKSKIDNTESNKTSPPSTSGESAPRHDENADWASSEIQPPLPLDPPPPDSPPPNILTLKKEIEDTEYTSPQEDSLEVTTETLISEIKIDKSEEQPEKPKPTMCKDFIRGTCKRIGTCKFAHECDTSQLMGVYTFCRNYQNAVCTFPNCKYVHATIFEEQRFYRTGVLPAHCLAHHKKPNIIQPPPPPPPPEEPVPAELPPNYVNAVAPSMHVVAEKSAPLMVVPSNALVPRSNDDVAAMTVSPGGMESDKYPKNCHKCDTMEYRLQYNKNRMDNMVRGIEDIDDKIRQVDKKQECLVEVLLGLFRTIPKHHEGINANRMTDKDKSVLLEQIKNYLNAGNRLNE